MTAFVAHGHELWDINYWAPIIDISKFTNIWFHARIGYFVTGGETHFLVLAQTLIYGISKITPCHWPSKICFQKWFWSSGRGETEKVESAPSQHFQFEHFPRFTIIFESRFLKKSYIITVLKKKWNVAISILKRQKMDFPLYFQILLGQW